MRGACWARLRHWTLESTASRARGQGHGVKGTGSRAQGQGHRVKGKHEGSQCTSVLARSFPGPGRDPLHVSAGLVTCGLPAMPRAALRILSCH